MDKKKSLDLKQMSVSKDSVTASNGTVLNASSQSLGALFLTDRSVDRLVDIDFLIKKGKKKQDRVRYIGLQIIKMCLKMYCNKSVFFPRS